MTSIGSKPTTTFRGDPEIFGTLVEDHDLHRRLLAEIAETQGASAQRKDLFELLTFELKAHAAAEEQAVWSTVLRKPEVTEDGRHAVAEHKEIDELLNELAARDMSSSAWLKRFSALRETYLHHIREEEQEQFVHADVHFDEQDKRFMKSVFKRRKSAELRDAKLEPELKAAR